MSFRCKMGTRRREVTELAGLWFEAGRLHSDAFDFGQFPSERFHAQIKYGGVAFSAEGRSPAGEILEWSGVVTEDPESGVPVVEGIVTRLRPDGSATAEYWFYGERAPAEWWNLVRAA